jgi:YihY family inner membrane protein
MKKIQLEYIALFFRETWQHFTSYRPTRMASSLSYYALFALVPILAITFWIGSIVLDTQTLASEILERVSFLLGSQSATFLQTTFANATILDGHSFRGIIAMIVLIVLAVTGISELKQNIDDIWETPYRRPLTVKSWLFKYLIPLIGTVIFGVAFVFLLVKF